MIIDATKGSKLKLKELFSYRKVLYMLIWKDIIVRYKDSLFGILWAIIRPVLTVLVFALIFSHIVKNLNSSLPYTIYVFCGIIVWNVFAGFITQGPPLLKGGMDLVKKIYFPRVYLPISCIGTLILDFFVSYVCLLILMLIKHTPFHPYIILLPLVFILTAYVALGIVFAISALNLKYRDFSFLIPFFIQIGFYVAPIIYSPKGVVNEKWMTFFNLNPVIAPIYLARTLVEGGSILKIWPSIWPSLAMSFLFIIVGVFIFKSIENEFADIG